MASQAQTRATQKLAATKSTHFARFLVMEQFAAREIGDRIRQARLERGLTQDDLASMASFSKRSLQDYERGVTLPYRHLRELGRLLDRRQDWFLYGDNESEAAVIRRLDALQQQMEELTRLVRRRP